VVNLKKVISVLDKATDLLSVAIRSGAGSACAEVCRVQELLLETLIDLEPSYNLDKA
jgi:hypothetical protein